MKKTTLVIFAAILFIAVSSFKNAGNSDGKIQIIFTHKLDINQLVKIKTGLAEKSIWLTYRKLAFDFDGKLTGIDFSVQDAKYGGSASNDNLTDSSRTGFFYDRTAGAKITFGARDN